MDPVRLRTATECEHIALEAELDLLRPSMTREDYAEVLARFHVFYRCWEEQAEATVESAVPGLFGPRRKAFRLVADLAALGYAPQPLSNGDREVKLPAMTNAAQTLGSMYVIEGSTLGGQILSRHFQKRFGVTPGCGCNFFSGYGERTSQMWREFRDVLASRPACEDECMIESAVATFKALRAWFPAK